ncbi:hypothetical protein BBJ29_005684 [Phytophthora kernoviae]|uniref:Pre-mRNA processing factor 4 (PRP4)-like domain-containing protein n=1 Tax=Phytophthora kernoviae TaxID=325452 RepID=A0A3R7GD48_9STRA|nr:hypothetical protein BBJ29_005684 [Phytophthora kernoviae]
MSERKGIYYGAISGVGDDVNGMLPSSVRSASGGGRMASNLETAMRAGNVNVSDNVETEVLQLSESSRAAQEKHAQLLRRIEAEKRARNIAVPTSVEEVIRRLRQLGEPITLFGERPADRRERLRGILSQLELEAEETGFVHQVLADIQKQGAVPGGDETTAGETGAEADQSDKPQEDELFYVPIKNEQLKKVRAAIFDHTTSIVGARLKRERQEKQMSEEERARTVDHHAAELYATTLRMANIASQNGDVRPLASVRYSADGAHVATGSWSSLVKVWDATNAAEIKVFRGHEDRVTGVAWHPNNTFSEMTDGTDSVCLCSGSADGTARLWSAGRSEPLAVLRGHKARLAKVAFHPLGNYVGTTSFDHTWRLWDVATARELLLQEGHYKEVYAIAFQKDGALAATGDLNGNGCVWDLRSGKSVLPLQGHSKQILSMDFAANGVQIASGSDDRSVRIWDLRQQKCSYMVPAHSNLVSEVRFSPASSELLLSASYDSSIKLWRTRDWKLMKTLRGHDGKVSSVGDKTTELKLYAVLSSDGGPPSCDFREMALARPFDACRPLTIDVTDKFVLVASVFGCPMHQKAAMADEAGAKGVIFVQRVGEKPLRVRLPPASTLPKAIRIPLAMVSTDSGARLLEQMAAVHHSSAGSSPANLPLGRQNLFFPDAKVFNPCEVDPMHISPLVHAQQGNLVDNFIAVRLRDPKTAGGCSLLRQFAYFEIKRPAGIIMADPRFPHAASSLSAAVAVQQISVPVVFISTNAFRTIQ